MEKMYLNFDVYFENLFLHYVDIHVRCNIQMNLHLTYFIL